MRDLDLRSIHLGAQPARICVREGYRPMRLTTHGRRHRATGLYVSAKAGLNMPWESRNELHAIWLAEVDPEIVDYRVQPNTIEGVIDGQRFSYTPDRMEWRSNGEVRVIEVKDSFEEKRDMFYSKKLAAARVVYESQGWTFCIQERDEIERAPRFRSVQEIQAYRHVAFSSAHVHPLQVALKADGAMTLASAMELLGNEPSSKFVVYALMVRRLLAIDLTTEISGRSLVVRV